MQPLEVITNCLLGYFEKDYEKEKRWVARIKVAYLMREIRDQLIAEKLLQSYQKNRLTNQGET